ncbi:aspartate aminotransferase family protein [Actinomadura fulvescens]|uniref:aspartate aminotransferase family protein n=1 Tax=Actinomadura fulvescens TaxID=46160 RepID=UPI0031E3DCE7
MITGGDGRRLTDAEGHSYLDFYSGVATSILGYRVPEVWDAVAKQLRTGVVHISPYYIDETRVVLAEKIAELSGIPDAKVVFTLTGSEAVDLALSLAALHRRSNQVLALRHAFHGTSYGAMAVTGDRRWVGMGLAPFHVSHVRGGYDRYHGVYRELDDAAYTEACTRDLTEVIGVSTADRVAAMIFEPVQGVAGGAPLAAGLLRAYQPILRQEEILLISDEVQTGWGRTGRHLWGYQHHDVVPDLLVFGKGTGAGFPIGGVVGRAEVLESMSGIRMSATSGDPLSVVAASVTIDYVRSRDLPANADRVGSLLLEGLRREVLGSAIVADVRGQGLMIAIELADPATGDLASEVAVRVQETCRRNGLLVGLGGTEEQCVSLLPPLTLTEAEGREGLAAIVSAVRSVEHERVRSVEPDRPETGGAAPRPKAAP